MSSDVRLAVLASGRGSNLSALLDAADAGRLRARIALVVANRSTAGALQTAQSRGIPHLHISGQTHADPGEALLAALREHAIDVVVLAGYLKRLDPRVCAAYEGRAVNIHPAPLPRFGGQGMYGHHVHAAVLAAGVATSGPTVHLVTDEYDEGAALAHTPVPVEPGDTAETLAQRVLAAEHALYWRVIDARFCADPVG
jgi:phosphoribosylglycinamide formyltransferase-1